MSPATSRPLAAHLSGLLDEIAGEPDPQSAAGRIPAAVLVALRPPGPTTAAMHDRLGVLAPGQGRAAADGSREVSEPDSVADLRVLLTRRRAHLRRHAGEIAFPGGRRDVSDGTLLETALREAEEEIGLARQRVLPLGALSVAYTLSTNYAVYPYVALLDAHAGDRAFDRPRGDQSSRDVTANPSAPGAEAWQISDQEVDAVLEPSLAQLEESRGRERLTRRGFSFETDVFTLGEDLIWGLTQRVLDDLLRRLLARG